MKVIKEAIQKAKLREKESEDFRFCIKYKICPECASDLGSKETTEDELLEYSCKGPGCDFKYTEFL